MNLLSRFPSLAWRMIFCVQALCFSTAFLAATLDAQNRAGNTRFVNPFIGTDGHGHTFPGATAPFGMVQLSPDTRFSGWDACGGYHYSDSTILGFSHTHLSGTGVADYGDILVVPSRGELGQAMEKRSGRESGLRFSHADEIASPGYYSVLFRQESIDIRFSPLIPRTSSSTFVTDLDRTRSSMHRQDSFPGVKSPVTDAPQGGQRISTSIFSHVFQNRLLNQDCFQGSLFSAGRDRRTEQRSRPTDVSS